MHVTMFYEVAVIIAFALGAGVGYLLREPKLSPEGAAQEEALTSFYKTDEPTAPAKRRGRPRKADAAKSIS
jgi:hypothetical protein